MKARNSEKKRSIKKAVLYLGISDGNRKEENEKGKSGWKENR